MDHEQLRAHVRMVAHRSPEQTRGLATFIAAGLWPGGAQDHSQRMALEWVRRWRPQQGAPIMPVCSCRLGHCVLCN